MASKLQSAISSLKPGDQFMILVDEGQPALPRERLVTVWRKMGTKIITTDGTTVSPDFNSEIIPTGTQLFEPPSLKAKEVWGNYKLENFDSEPE